MIRVRRDRRATPTPRGGDFYDDDSTRARYLAHRDAQGTSPIACMEEPAFLAALGDIVGSDVVDLGCGDGSTAALIMGLGARTYLGIDGSTRMIERANGRHRLPRVEFVHGEIEKVFLPDETFDVVISRMAFHYVELLEPVVARIRSALRSDGRIVFTVVHPVISCHDASGADPRTSWLVDDYFVRGPRRRAWLGSTVTWHHRTIADYVRMLTRHRYRLESIDECEPNVVVLADDPDELADDGYRSSCPSPPPRADGATEQPTTSPSSGKVLCAER